MPSYQAISRERHAKQYWHLSTGYSFAAQEAIVPLVSAELPKAMMSMPIALTELDGGYVPAAVLSLLPGKNLFVAENGTWTGAYIPSPFRTYPFRLLKAEDGRSVLCIDEDSGFFSEGPEGLRFFTEEGQPSKPILDILNVLNQVEQSRISTAAASAVLQKHRLVCPWPITLKTETGDKQINGLFQIDEAALNQLSAEALHEVSQSGGLLIAYCQLLSMQHLPLLGQLLEAQAKAAEQAQALQQLAPNGELDLEFLNQNGTISFAGLF